MDAFSWQPLLWTWTSLWKLPFQVILHNKVIPFELSPFLHLLSGKPWSTKQCASAKTQLKKQLALKSQGDGWANSRQAGKQGDKWWYGGKEKGIVVGGETGEGEQDKALPIGRSSSRGSKSTWGWPMNCTRREERICHYVHLLNSMRKIIFSVREWNSQCVVLESQASAALPVLICINN